MLTPTQHILEILAGIDDPTKVFLPRRGLGKTAVIVSDEAWQECVGRLHRADAGKPQFLHQTILQRRMRALDTALCLARIGTKNLDVQFR